MKTEKYDVAVVGGGPGGSNSARLVKEKNPDLDVAVFERNESPTANCAGGLGIPFKKFMGFKPPESCIKSKINNVVVASPNEEASISSDDVYTSEVDWVDEDEEMGWVVDRDKWDQYQLDMADEEGVDIRTKHTVKSLDQNGHVNLEVLDREENEEINIEADYTVLCNGVNWKLAEEAGFDPDELQPPKSELHMGLQYEFEDPEFFDKYDDETIYLYFDRDYAPNGYTWSFAAGDGYTKWGAGIPMSEDASVKKGLHDFFEDKGKMEMMEETTRKTTNAIIPTATPLDTCVIDNVALVGDTAHHCDSLHGGGMLFATRASNQVAKAITKRNLSLYDQYWKDDLLETLQNRFVLRDLIHNMDNDEYDRFIKSFQGFEVTGINPDYQIPRMMWHCFKKDKGIFTKSVAQSVRSIVRRKALS